MTSLSSRFSGRFSGRFSDLSETPSDNDGSVMSIDMNKNKNKVWRNAQGHRLGGPAVLKETGEEEWWINNELHRLDGPAAKWRDGSLFWYVNDKLHRLDGPAIERGNGTREWFAEGKRHRLDGPAIERADGTKEWWLFNSEVLEEDFNMFCRIRRNRLAKETHQNRLARLDRLSAAMKRRKAGPA